jgi:hypothetical protein
VTSRVFAPAALIVGFASALCSGDELFAGRSWTDWTRQLSSSDAPQRVEAAWAIAQMAARGPAIADDAALEKSLTQLTADADSTLRYWGAAGWSLYAKRAPDKARAAGVKSLQSLLTDKAPAPRIAAAEALGLLGHAEQALPVLTAAMDHPQDSVRIQAVAAVEKLGPAARPAMTTLEKATQDPSEYVKRISSRALTALGGTAASPLPKAKAGKGKKAKTKQ